MKALLLSINPEHVENILNETKRFEFRKNRCRYPVDSLIIYSTAPVKKIVGEAHIIRIIEDSPEEIWNKTKDAAGITKRFFDEYYNGKKKAVAYELGDVIKYAEPKMLSDFGLRCPPQSFSYVDCRSGTIPRMA